MFQEVTAPSERCVVWGPPGDSRQVLLMVAKEDVELSRGAAAGGGGGRGFGGRPGESGSLGWVVQAGSSPLPAPRPADCDDPPGAFRVRQAHAERWHMQGGVHRQWGPRQESDLHRAQRHLTGQP